MSLVNDEKIQDFKEEFLTETNNRYAPTATFAAGSKGLVPAPTSEDIENELFLRADGTWGDLDSDSGELKIVSWGEGTTKEILAMVAAADAGLIDLKDYWTVGDVRQVLLEPMEATGVGESHVAQVSFFTLMDADNTNYEYVEAPSSGETHCRFVVGTLTVLMEQGYINPATSGFGGWGGCARRTWCNEVFRNAIPSTLRPIFKQVKVKAMNGGSGESGSALVTSNDYFFLPAEKEIFGSKTYSADVEANALTQWEYCKTEVNKYRFDPNSMIHIGKEGYGSSSREYWLRSVSSYQGSFLYAFYNYYDKIIKTSTKQVTEKTYISVCGCI